MTLRLCLLFLSSLLISACANKNIQTIALNESVLVQNASIKSDKKVLVINSNQSIDRYQEAEATYLDSLLDTHVTVLNLETESRPIEYLQDIINHHTYDVIYCIGAKALGSIDFIDPDVPVVYSSVLNWRKFQERDSYFGIASELSPQVQLTWLKYFFPEISDIGVFYSDENQSLIDEANTASSNLALNLKPFKLNGDDQLISSAEQLLKSVDALWLISDPNTLSSIKSVNALFKAANKLKVPVITYNPLFMDVGAMMSLVADLPTTARQAALLTIKLIENNTPKNSVQFPAGSRIILNTDKVNDYEIKLNLGALDSVDELY